MSSTVYDVKIRYGMDDRGTARGLGTIANQADRAARSTFSLKGALATLGGGALLTVGKRTLIDYNNEIDKMRIGMSTIISMQFKKPFEEARAETDKLFARFQDLAKKSPSTTKDFIQMGSALAPVVAQLGGGVREIEKMAQGGLLAALATGTHADIAAVDIQQMLAGQVEKPDKMANQLLASRKIDAKDFNAMSASQRMGLVQDILQDPALLRSADEFGKSFAGTVSTFQDQLEMALGKVGMPLMKALGDEVARWNSWIEKHPRTISKIVNQVGGMISSTFDFVRSTASWLVDNQDTILALAKTFLVFKGASLATNVFKTFADGAGNLVTSLKTAAGTISGVVGGAGAGGLVGSFRGVIGVLSGAGGVIPIFATLAGAAYQLWKGFNDINNSQADRARRMDFSEALGTAGDAVTRLRELDKIFAPNLNRADHRRAADSLAPDVRKRLETERANLKAQLADPAVMGSIVRALSDTREKHGLSGFRAESADKLGAPMSFQEFEKLFATNKEAKSLIDELSDTYKRLGQLSSEQKRAIFESAFPEQFPNRPVSGTPDGPDMSAWNPGATKSDVKITIQKIEVASEDPDRFVHGLVNVATRALKNPTQATSTIPGGF